MKIFNQKELQHFTDEQNLSRIARICSTTRQTVNRVLRLEFNEIETELQRTIVMNAIFELLLSKARTVNEKI